MGNSTFDPSVWAKHATRNAHTTSAAQVFANPVTGQANDKISDDLNPKKFTFRESVDSDANPNSTPIILGLDVTGSMHHIAHVIAKTGLGVLGKEIYDRLPVKDPHILIAGIGDANCDHAPFQATQFEACYDKLMEQLTKLFLEGGGGGNGSESYSWVWYLAAMMVKADSFAKRKKKGYIFTIGDDGPNPELTQHQLSAFLAEGPGRGFTARELLDMAQREWNVFHLNILEGGTGKSHDLMPRWQKLLGERVLPVSDHTKVAEVIVSAIQVNEGADADAVAASWSGDTSLVVQNAVRAMTKGAGQASDGAVRI